MGLLGKMEAEVEISKSNGEEIFQIFSGKAHHTSKLCPEIVQKVDLHEGDWDTPGSIKVWTYVTTEGKVETIKEKVSVDEKSKTVTLTGLEGDYLELYNTYIVILHFIPKGETSMVVKLTLEYEKKNDDVPLPQKYIDFGVGFIKGLDAQLTKQ
ncbi:hypothetical protein U1Q18_041703 [Sarracenia purpurea var. burkii]